ncbi:MAG TPA: DMT family transporter [Candidatus Acidoferrales bacterium]|nr:DMT family transporter [Candidatus Acidoferrales bacterium]
MRIVHKGAIALAFVAVELAFMTVLMSVGGGSIGVLQFLFFTLLVATAVSLLVSFAADRCAGLVKILRSRKTLAIMALVGVLDIGMAQLLLTIGSLGANPSVAGIVYRSWVIIMALLSPLVLSSKITLKQMLAFGLGFIGVYIVATNGSLVGVSASELPYIAAILGAAVCVALANVAIKRYNADTVGSVVVFNAASLVFSALLLVAYHQTPVFNMPIATLAAALFLGGITYGVGNILYMYSLKKLNQMLVGSATLAVPFLTVVLSFLLLGTQIKIYYIVAAAFVGAAIFIQYRASSLAPERVRSRNLVEQMQIFDITGAFTDTRSPTIEGMVNGGNRALAVKLDEGEYKSDDHNEIFERNGCVAFTDREPHKSVRPDELQFIRDMLGVESDQTVLIGLGNPDRIEMAFDEFHTVKRGDGEEPKVLS